MDIVLLVKSIAGLALLLGILIFLLLYTPAKKKKILKKTKVKVAVKEEEDTSLVALRKIIRNKNATTQKLKETLTLVLKHHGKIHPKLGLRPHPDFDAYGEILFTIARHHNVNKDIIIKFDKELERRNPEYKQEINEALMKGLNSRGF